MCDVRADNFAISVTGVTWRNFTRLWDTRQARNVCTTFGRGAPTNFGRTKTSKFRRDFWQLSTLRANNSGIDRHKENLNSKLQPLPRWEIWWTLVHKQKSYRHATGLFSGAYISAFRGYCPLKFFTHTVQPLKLYFQLDLERRPPCGRPQVGLSAPYF